MNVKKTILTSNLQRITLLQRDVQLKISYMTEHLYIGKNKFIVIIWISQIGKN